MSVNKDMSIQMKWLYGSAWQLCTEFPGLHAMELPWDRGGETQAKADLFLLSALRPAVKDLRDFEQSLCLIHTRLYAGVGAANCAFM